MNDKEKELITKLVMHYISYEYFLEVFPINIEQNTDYFDKLLNGTCIKKNNDDLDLLFLLGFELDLFEERHIEILNRLIIEDWHKSHLNIAILLQYFKSNLSVESLYKTILTKYDPTECTHPLLVRCMWALGDINTDESKEKLILLSREKDEFTRKNAKEQLIRIRKEMRINMRR